MKWIGQQTYDTAVGDITGITAGTGLDGGGTTGNISLSVDVSDFMDSGAAGRVLTASGTDAFLANDDFTWYEGALNLTGFMDISPSASAGAAALTIDNDDTDQIALDIDAANIDANVIDISATALTSGKVIFIDTDSNTASEIAVDRDITSTRALAHTGMINLNGTKAVNTASGETHVLKGIASTITDTGSNVGDSNLTNIELNSNINSFSSGGSTKLYGISNTVTGQSTDTVGYYSNIINGQADIKMVSSVDTGDYCSIGTAANGATTITTVDDDATAAHFEVAADGNITLDSAAAINLEAVGNVTSESDGTWKWWKAGNTSDFLQLDIGTHGNTTLSTTDAAAAAADFEIAADGDITLDAAGDIKLEAAGDDLTLDADHFTFTSATSQKPRIDIIDSADDTDGSRFRFIKNRGAAGQDNDLISAVQFMSYNDAGTPELLVYSSILSNITDATDGQETGKMDFYVATHGGGQEKGLSIKGGSQDDEVDVDIGLGTASVTTVAGDLTVTGSDLTFDSVALTAIQTSGESFADNDTSLMTSAAIDDKINTKYSTSYFSFSAKSTSNFGTNYIFGSANGLSDHSFNVDSGVDSAGDFGGVTTEQGGSGTDATASMATAALEQQMPIPETCKLIGFYATGTTSTSTGAGYDVGVGIWHIPEANVNWGEATAGTATLIHKSDSSRHSENTSHGGTSRKKVQMIKRMDGTAKDLAAGDILIPSVFGETADQQIMATITLVFATPIKTI